MAKKVRFPLMMDDNTEANTLEELQEHFSLERVMMYLESGELVTWLKDRYMDDVADALDGLTYGDEAKVCAALGVPYQDEAAAPGAEDNAEKLQKLEQYTDDPQYRLVIDRVAFDNDDLYDLLDEGATEIYLCGERFSIPVGKQGIAYIGINNPVVVIPSKQIVDFGARHISFSNVRFDEKYEALLQQYAPGQGAIPQAVPAEDAPDYNNPDIKGFLTELTKMFYDFIVKMKKWNMNGSVTKPKINLLDYFHRRRGSDLFGGIYRRTEDWDEFWRTRSSSRYDHLLDAKIDCQEELKRVINDVNGLIEKGVSEILSNADANTNNYCTHQLEAQKKFLKQLSSFFEKGMEFYTGAKDFISNEKEKLQQMESDFLVTNEDVEKLKKPFVTENKLSRSVDDYMEMCSFERNDNKFVFNLAEAAFDMQNDVNHMMTKAYNNFGTNSGAIFTDVDNLIEERCNALLKTLGGPVRAAEK